ncbi:MULTISPECIES: lytic polysaccharide monooxygenase [unclassified Streptomyces]|uniref:lytic polysaccharide monooxygenase auxiliary activity family 9 protein n=1 Tax=unclassified Streptomyces TaxID=2593676 RepID=UPI0006FCAC3F|nr:MULTISPECIES: lytic polysaccharide monooxygenase [unclassified Streptomyces]KQX54991.1 chitin-binding protein [Streptomyces sp. Root1304]KRA94509.1 chitin-binding protein [Streptomyces sp. Root66D1]
MTSRRTAAVALATGALALSGLASSPAFAHGSMTDPVSRVSACYAEGPEAPKSAACKAAVAASGAQAFYDWNAVNIANAAGQHRRLIPDGKLCSAGNDKYRGLDLARADWPASPMASGAHTFRYKGTAPHRGSFALYVTKDGYDPSKPLKWSDLEEKPFATVTDPGMQNGDYVFQGTVPKKSGRHLIYSIWQRSDSPEAFYTCSDVVFGKDSGGTGPAPTASAPSEQQIEDGQDESSVEHGGHGDGDASTGAGETAAAPATGAPESSGAPGASSQSPNAPAPAAGSGSGVELAETGGDATTPYLAVGGAAVLAAGAAVLFGTTRRRRTQGR